MPTAFPEDSPEYGRQAGFEETSNPENTPLTTEFDNYHASLGAMLEFTTTFPDDPSDKNHLVLKSKATAVLTTFRKLAEVYVDEDDPIETGKALAQIILEQEIIQDTHFYDLVEKDSGCNFFQEYVLSFDKLVLEAENLEKPDDNTKDNVVSYYLDRMQGLIQTDLNHFLEHATIAKEDDSSPQTEYIPTTQMQRLQIAGWHVFDIAKNSLGIAGGITLGALAVKRIFKFPK